MKTVLAVIALVVAPLVASASAYSDAVTGEASILYYWPMDSCGGTGTLTASVGGVDLGSANVSCGVAGQVGNAAYFNGTSAYAQSVSAIDLTAYNHITVEFLTKPDAYANTDQIGVEFGTGTSANGDFMFTQDNAGGLSTDQLPLLSGNVGLSYAQYTKYTAVTWHHVAIDYDMSKSTDEVDLYVDGVLKTPGARPVNANNTGTFGNRTLNVMSRNAASLFAAGTIQHLAIYSGLSAARIAVHNTQAFTPSYPIITYSFVRGDLWDNGYNNTSDDPRQSVLSRVRFRTNSTYVTLSATQELFPYYPDYTEIVAKVDGTALTPYAITPDAGTFTIQLSDAGTLRTVELIGSTQYAWAGINGTFINSVTYRDGGTFTVQTQPAAQSRTVFYGDSIAAGFGADVPATESYVAVLRDMGFAAMGESYGGRTLALDADTAPHRAAFVAKMATFSPSTIWLAIGVNDWGVPAWSAANFGVAYAATVDDLHTSMPTARIVCQTPILRSVETANVHGDTLGAYRAQITTICGARPWTTLVDGTAILALGDLADGTHPSTAGHAKYAAYIAGVLNPRKNPPRVGGRRGITIKN